MSPSSPRSTPTARQLAAAMLALAAIAGCRAPVTVPRETFDFDAAPGPAPAAFATDATIEARWAGGLRAFWDSGEAGTLSGVDGVPVPWRRFRAVNEKAAIVLVPGNTEAIIKYADVAQDLVAQGYTVYTLSLRGQGAAGRMLPDPEKVYVAWFEDYVTDTHRFLSEVVRPGHGRVFVLAHSLGGAVSSLVNDRYPDDVDALVLSAPMLEINLGAFPPSVAATLGLGACSATDGSGYAIGSGPWEDEALDGFEGNGVTSSEPRWWWKVRQIQADPAIRHGGITWRWLCQALAGSSEAQAAGAYSATPTLLIQAGRDSYVKPGGQSRYCADAPRCTLLKLDDAQHEVLQERDELRSHALSRVVTFFDAQVTP